MNEKLNIRKAVLEDLPILNLISVESKRFWGYPDEWIIKWKKDLTVTEIDFESMLIYAAEVNGNIVGFGAIKELDHEYEIMHLWILPGFMKKGIGKTLLQYLLESAREKKPIKVESDPNAYEFYTKMGFKKVGKIQSYPVDRYLPVLIMNQL